jgi:hypothetical protein
MNPFPSHDRCQTSTPAKPPHRPATTHHVCTEGTEEAGHGWDQPGTAKPATLGPATGFLRKNRFAWGTG